VHLPFVTAEFHRPHIPGPRKAGREVQDAAGRVLHAVPRPGRTAYFGGLGLAAVVGVLEWPVAVAIGIGTAVARGARREPAEPPGNDKATR
jgi:hypothetical protein